MTELALRLRREINTHPLISKYFHVATPEEMVPAEFRASGIKDYGPPHSELAAGIEAWDRDEFALDPTRLTIICGSAGFDGTQFKGMLAERFDIQINKTSRNSILVQTNINNTRSDAALLIKVLADLSREIEQRLAQGGPSGAGGLRGAGEVADDRRARPAELQPLPGHLPRQPEGASNEATCARRSSWPTTRRTASS